MKNSSLYPIVGSMLLATFANAQTVVYSENFDTIPSALVDFNFQLGGNPDLLPESTKILSFGQWGLTANGSFPNVGGANGTVLRPQQAGRTNARNAGVFLDPSLFAATGAGTYTLYFDVVAGTTENGTGRVYVGTGSGYDLSGGSDAKLNLSVSAPGLNVNRSTGVALWSALTGRNGATATHHTVTPVEWVMTDGTATGEFVDTPGILFSVAAAGTSSVEFPYDGSSAVVLAFTGFDSDYGVDNLRIETASPAGETWAGFPIFADGYVSTEDWLGWVYVRSSPWVWVNSFSKWLYMPESSVSASGAWAYAPN